MASYMYIVQVMCYGYVIIYLWLCVVCVYMLYLTDVTVTVM